MKEAQVIANGNMYIINDLAEHLRQLGVSRGDCVCVHTSMSKIGWVCGAEQAVAEALMRAVGDDGTIVVPTQSGFNSEPADWRNPPVPKEWQQAIRDNTPAYQPDKSPTRGMGRVSELLRKWPGAVRSGHPNASFAAWGALSRQLMRRHELAYALGENSPCKAMYDINAKILLIGVTYTNCTIMHLGEYRSGKRKGIKCGAAIMENGQRVWKEYDDIELDADEFLQPGKRMEEAGKVRIGRLGDAECRLFHAVDAVDATRDYLQETV